MLQRLAIGLLVVVATAPIAFFLFVLGLVVHEAVILPTATLATGVFAALGASWATDAMTSDEKRTLVNQVAARSLIWSLIPAILMLAASFFSHPPPIVWMSIAVIYASVMGLILASRHRTEIPTTKSKGVNTLFWLIGSAAAVTLVIFIASLFGLTGA